MPTTQRPSFLRAMEGYFFKETSWSTAVAKSPVRKLVLAGLLIIAGATVEAQRVGGQLNVHEVAPEAGGADAATAARSIVGNPAPKETEQHGGNGARGLQQGTVAFMQQD